MTYIYRFKLHTKITITQADDGSSRIENDYSCVDMLCEEPLSMFELEDAQHDLQANYNQMTSKDPTMTITVGKGRLISKSLS